MTPKEEAKNLMSKFKAHVHLWDYYNDIPEEENHARECAIIYVKGQIQTLNKILNALHGITVHDDGNPNLLLQRWKNVQDELEKL